MDEQVLRGMAKWPNVPAVYGWLALDCRGKWVLQGEPIGNPTVTAYIARNYERDGEGRWFFQNGPQRVFVDLDYTPFVYRTVGSAGPIEMEAHTGARVTAVSGAWIDENGAMLLETEHGVGVVDGRDLDAMLAAIVDANGVPVSEDTLDEIMSRLQQGEDAALWLKVGESNVKVRSMSSAEVPARFQFVAHPTESRAQAAFAASPSR